MIKGKDVLPYLAQIYWQLYIVPGQPDSENMYNDTVRKGLKPLSEDLSHFIMHEEDRSDRYCLG